VDCYVKLVEEHQYAEWNWLSQQPGPYAVWIPAY
jgi:hypothetical protein